MSASDPSYPLYPVAAFVTATLVLIPFGWHLQAWNAGTCLYMFWAALTCLNFGVNSILWHGTAVDLAPVWCDISSRIIVASSVAIPMASLCINRRLYKIATLSSVNPLTRSERRRSVLIDLLLVLGIPLLQVILQYVVSGHRYDIYEDIGCFPFTYNTALSYPLSVVWPVVIGLVSAVYCILTLRAFLQRRAQFAEFLQCNSALTTSRYFRLMALATTELCCTTPIASYGIWLNLNNSPRHPWISWADTHWHFSKVDLWPSLLWRMDHNTAVGLELTRWSPIACGLIFFAFFGFAGEAQRHYREGFVYIKGLLPKRFSSFSSHRHRRAPVNIPLTLDRTLTPSSPSSTDTYCAGSPTSTTSTFTVYSKEDFSGKLDIVLPSS